jgi:NADPH:quinone reductase
MRHHTSGGGKPPPLSFYNSKSPSSSPTTPAGAAGGPKNPCPHVEPRASARIVRMKAVVADPVGGPENLRYIDLPEPQIPPPGQAVVAISAIGVNYIDVYFRTGFYKAPETPVRLGNEASGTVVAVGEGVSLAPGTRVAYAMARGAYAEYATVPAAQLVPLPDDVPLEQAAAVMLQGMTAHYLTHSTFPLGPGSTCLVHAAAGGAGSMVVQLAKIAGARVIGTAGTPEKAAFVRNLGADHVVIYSEADFEPVVREITSGKGVDVVYDSVGAATFHKSLNCLRPRGMMVTFGQSSGPVGNIDPLILSQKGSLFLTRPTLAYYIADPAELHARAADLFSWLESGRLKVHIHKTYPLSGAADAHRDLEARRSTGKLLLIP